ncbi:TonB-dependent receptor [Anditalea andensis]|uniref:Cobalamin receptor n=1 Tax=Anditalea andensis TaxID=1048983 RepID=A0A074L1S0_9BACT|nr:TonB-dependent receptor plug domain-containing protein [Anditalea andensis]KEO74445.1 cobalamin receptor [Anditalea andensis]
MKIISSIIFLTGAVLLTVAPVNHASAQQVAGQLDRDTIPLEQVEVYAPPLDRFTNGQTVRTVDSRTLEEFAGQNLGEVLQQRTGIFVRQYGPGMIASVTMRGAAAGHTAVFWNGIPINSASLGQSDFSILPTNGFDQATVHQGSSGALYGTDAIGGSIHLNSKLSFGLGSKFSFYQGIGSFGRMNNQLQYSYSNQKIATTTRIYRNFTENNYPYTNRAKFGSPTERQDHAAIEQYGVNQDIGWNVGENSQLSTSLWWNLTDREIQPVMGSNTHEVQKDQNLRWVMDYFRFGTSGTWNVKLGAVHDELLFNRSSQNLVTQYFASSDYEHSFSENWQIKSGIRYTQIEGNLSTYEATDNRLELYHSSSLEVSDKLALSVNLRQLVYEGTFAPFTPSISGGYAIYQADRNALKINGAFSRSFKVPTINDRFWVPGGNPDLLSEDSWSGEIGLVHTFEKERFKVETQATYFKMWVDNWIIWLPTGNFWSPTNYREVQNQGLEIFTDALWKINEWSIIGNVNYAYTHALILSEDNENTHEKQLPYTPVHKGSAKLGLRRGAIGSYINLMYVGENFVTTDNTLSIPSYEILSAGMDYKWRFKKMSGTANFQIFNLLNTEYQVMRQRPMPGRNYQLNININIL